MKWTIARKYSYLWVTGIIFIATFVGHWTFAWHAYVEEQEAHNQPVEVKSYFIEVSRDTLENWQSEFLQLMWQVAGLAFLFYVGSPQSKEGDERMEEKMDYLIEQIGKKEGEDLIKKLDTKYARQ